MSAIPGEPKVDLRVAFNSNKPKDWRLPGWVDSKFSIYEGEVIDGGFKLGEVNISFHTMKMSAKRLEGETPFFKHYFQNN
jgi:hypothetical protein